jgi:hypothetical protein
MIKTKTIVIVLMVSSIIDKKSPPVGGRPGHRATDLRWRTRMKHARRTLERLNLSSRYLLKRSKIDISLNVNCFLPMHWAQYTNIAQSMPD